MNQILFLFLTISILFVKNIHSDEVIRGVKYFKPNSTFSSVSDLYIQKGIISRITESKQNSSIRYVIPSFCDAYVTLGADATGGQNNLSGIKTALNSFIQHGFTHIQTISDGPWIHSIKSEIDKGKILGPKITIATRPIIQESAEVSDISELLYFHADNANSTITELKNQLNKENKTIHIVNRYNEDGLFQFDSRILNQMRLETEKKGKFLTIHTFADRIAIIDALISGNRYLIHPILFEMQNEISKQHIQELNYIPILNVYRNLHLTDNADGEGISELDFLKKNSKYFSENYSGLYESYLKLDIEKNELESRTSEYNSYIRFINENHELKEKMILGSGSGNRLSFPGISGIQELKILSSVLKLNESILQIPTRNACTYLGGAYNGQLKQGNEANFIILKENPIKNIDTLFQIEQVYLNGKQIKKSDKENKKRRR